MKVYNLHAVNKLQYEDIPIPQIPPGWALVQVYTVGICSSDIPRIFSKGTYHFPTIPGHEFSGIVTAVGTETDNKWLQKRVSVFPLIPCQNCQPCSQKKYEMCEHYDYIGSRRDGAYAEYVAVPVWNLIELPSELSLQEAALLEPLAVSLHAAKKACIQKGDRVAIIGTGMIGFAAAQWCKILGASHVVVYGRSDKKKSLASNIPGVEYAILANASTKYDVIIEAVGSNSAITSSVDLADNEGRIVLMGNPEGDIAFNQDIYWKILRKQLSLIGTWNSTYDSGEHSDWTEVIDALKNKKIDVVPLITHTFKKEDCMKALELMKNQTEIYCKVVVNWNEE